MPIDCAFDGCGGLESIKFNGTVKQWIAVKVPRLGSGIPAKKVICSDGEVDL